MLSDKSLRDLAITAVSAGAIKGLSSYLKVSTQPHGFTEQARYHLLKAGVNTTVQTTIGGQDFKDSWKANMLRAAVDTAAGTAANNIGEAYKSDDPILNYITHKIAHGIVGGITGAVVADDAKRGAIAGAIGGIVSEMVAEQFSASSQSAFDKLLDDSQGQRLDQKAFEASYDQKINGQMAADFGRLGAGLVSLLAKQDVNISIDTATNAVENNFIPAVIAGGLLAWEAYDIYCTARDEGFEAAALKLGFDFVIATTGSYAGKRIYQLGTIAAPTAIEAIQAYKQAYPVFAKLYDQAGKVMAKGAQAYQKFQAKAEKAWKKTTSKVGEGFSKKIGVEFEPQFWTKSVQLGKNKVYQRNDLIDPKYIDTKGRSNLQLMRDGKAPIGPDGEKINLHHMLQTQDGGIAEVTQTFHQQYTKTIHINPKTMGSGIDRNDFGGWRKNYWKLRSKDFE